jgi:hypothetical protein
LRVFHGGSFIASSGYTTYDANELDEEIASPETSSSHHTDIGTATVARDQGVSAWGGSSIRVTFDAATSGVGIDSAYYPAVSSSTDYIAAVAFLGDPGDTYTLRLAWLDSGKSLISNSDATAVVGSFSTWTVITKTATSPGTAAYLDIQLLSTGSGTEGWVDCWMLSQCQTVDQWFHPATQPLVIDFSAAPTSGDRVQVAAGESYSNCRCRLMSGSVGGPMVLDGHQYPGTLRAIEDVL